MNARYARAMHLNPLLGEARVVDISNIKMDADERTIHLIEECPEFPGRQQEAWFRIAVLATEQLSRLQLALDDANGLGSDLGIARRERSLPMKAGRNVGDHQTGIFHLAAQLRYLRVGGVHLEPRDLPEPLLETPTSRDHVVADRFFHNTLLRGPAAS